MKCANCLKEIEKGEMAYADEDSSIICGVCRFKKKLKI